MLTPLKKMDLRSQVSEQLKKLIISGELKPGQSLMEVKLAKSLGVSRTPVREALQILHSAGFIVESTKGYSVPQICVDEAGELYNLTGLIEASLITDIRNFNLIRLKKIDSELSTTNLARHKKISLDRAFHETLVLNSKNKTAKNVLKNLRQKSLRYEFLNYSKNSNFADSSTEHAEIIESIERKRYEETARLIQLHWQQSATRLEKILQ